MTTPPYQNDFFDWVDRSAARSARAFVPHVAGLLSPASVLDVGCGRGTWLKTWINQPGVHRVRGIDGDYVDRSKLAIPHQNFDTIDLESDFSLGERFDLVQCLEVAEHLSPAAGPKLVTSLTRHGRVVLFSAASPGQGGEFHINEREPEYWRSLFTDQGYQMYDSIRPRIANIRSIDPWYRYNTFVFCQPETAERLGIAGDFIPASRDAPRYEPFSWKIRKLLLKRLPPPVVTRLSRAKYQITNRVSQAGRAS
jgi:SAM-dependent methyltransferase